MKIWIKTISNQNQNQNQFFFKIQNNLNPKKGEKQINQLYSLSWVVWIDLGASPENLCGAYG